MHPIINRSELWKVYHASSPSRAKRDRDPGVVWDKRASTYARMTDDAHEVAAREVEMMDLRPSDTVLDVGGQEWPPHRPCRSEGGTRHYIGCG